MTMAREEDEGLYTWVRSLPVEERMVVALRTEEASVASAVLEEAASVVAVPVGAGSVLLTHNLQEYN